MKLKADSVPVHPSNSIKRENIQIIKEQMQNLFEPINIYYFHMVLFLSSELFTLTLSKLWAFGEECNYMVICELAIHMQIDTFNSRNLEMKTQLSVVDIYFSHKKCTRERERRKLTHPQGQAHGNASWRETLSGKVKPRFVFCQQKKRALFTISPSASKASSLTPREKFRCNEFPKYAIAMPR